MTTADSEETTSKQHGTGEEWEHARHLLRPVKPPHPNFVAAIRTLVKEWRADKPLNQNGAGFEARRFLMSRTVKATYYYATKSYCPELLKEPDLGSGEPYLNHYSAFDHAAILGYLCLFRIISKLSDREEWGYVQEPLYDALDLGAIIGNKIQNVGFGFGLLTRGMRYICFAPFLWNSKKEFQNYRRHLKKNDLDFDLEWEKRVWNCTTIELSTILLQQLGFNFGVSESYYLALSRAPSEASPYYSRFLNADIWMGSIMDSGEAPKSGLSPDFRLNSSEEEDLIRQIEKLHSGTERIEWLNKGKGSISPETTPELFDSTVSLPAGEDDPSETV